MNRTILLSAVGLLASAGLWLFAAGAIAAEPADDQNPVDYQKEVKPILLQHCLRCHGPDEQQSDLRIDTGKFLIEGGISGAAIVAGEPAESPLLLAVRGMSDEISQMPPEEEEDVLSAEEIDVLERWVAAGAVFPKDESPQPAAGEKSEHWSFLPIMAPKIPAIEAEAVAHNPIDAFVLDRLKKEGLPPSPPADRATLIRRVSFDLIGLPPSPEEVRAFLADSQPDAYERLVDRLLASPMYGERWGRHWLDQARYADSDGYTNDVPRVMWRYRDWVIDAINQDLPFDQFTVEQFAGDLLPNPTPEQIIATGFHRCTQINHEGGSDAEQYRVEAVVDRVSTTGSVYLGLTLGCARCHEHKFDPISQGEFYQLFAFLNSQDEPTYTVSLDVPEAALLPAAQQKVNAASAERTRHLEQSKDARMAWETALAEAKPPVWKHARPTKIASKAKASLKLLDDDSILAEGKTPNQDEYELEWEVGEAPVEAIRLEVLTHDSLPGGGPGRAGNGNFVLNRAVVELIAADGAAQAVKILDGRADHEQDKFPVSHALDGNPKTGWAINVGAGQGSIHTNRTAIFALESALPAKSRVRLRLSFHDKKYAIGRLRVSCSSTPASLALAEKPADLLAAAKAVGKDRTKEQTALLENAFRQTDAELQRLDAVLKQRQAELARLKSVATTTTYTMRERKKPRDTFIHIRGDFLRPGKRVTPKTPSVFPAMKTIGETPNRLDLANWLVDKENPLTARVTVNRTWQYFFGQGIVVTEGDFGLQGEPPSHPQLLDWLAAELVRKQWSMKQLHRLVVRSATYRQASRARPDLTAADPQNRLLARQTRMRVESETIRDAALAVAGLLSHKMHGPSVFPPQPDTVMKMTRNPNRGWKVSPGEDRYRRGLYTYFWRNTPYAFLKLFNSPESNTTCTRRERSNTSLQALTLLNDEVFVEAAQGLAVRVLREAPQDDVQRIRYVFQICFSREPSAAELAALKTLLEEELAAPAEKNSPRQFAAAAWLPEKIDAREFLAWTTLARTLLNVDEFITRE